MIRLKISLLILTFILLGQSNFIAQQKISLTVDQAIEIGLKNSKTLHSSSMKLVSADAKLSEVNAARLPSIKLSAVYRRLSSVDPFSIVTPFGTFDIAPNILNNYTTQLSLMQPLFTGFRLSSSSDIAEFSAKAAVEDYNRDKSELVFNIKNAYWNLYKAKQMKIVSDENVNQIKSHLDDARNLMRVGMLTQNDVLKLEVQLSDALYKQVDADNAVKLSALALSNVLSIPLNTDFELNYSPEIVTKNFDDINTLIEIAFEKRPELKAAGYKIKSSEAAVTAAKSNWYPQINLFGNYYYSRPNQRIFPSKDEFNGTWDAGVSLSMNVWDWLTTSHQTEQAEAALAQTNDMMEIIKDNIILDVTQNYLNLNQSKQKIEIAQFAIQQAEENMRVTGEKFKSGLALTSDTIDAELALLMARTNYVNSITDYELAKSKLEKSIGQ